MEDKTTHVIAAREAVLNAAGKYFEIAHAPQDFIPGTTYIPASAKSLDAEDLHFLIDASLDMWLTAGRYANALEARIADRLGHATKALLVNSGSSANLVATSALASPLFAAAGYRPLEKGDEIITAAVAFPTTVNPIVQNGWVPVFVDVDPLTLNVRPESVMAARTPKTRAVVMAHTLGNPFRADVLADWCAQEKIYLIEDCSDALGAGITQEGKTVPVGSFGEFATLSFYPAHHITTGEGGAVLAKNASLRRVAESLRDWGRDCWCLPGVDNSCGKRFDWKLGELPYGHDHKYIFSSLGYNLKMTEMQAALGLSQLKKLEQFAKLRAAHWALLNAGVKHSKLLNEHLTVVQATEGTVPSWFGFGMHCGSAIDRRKLTAFLESRKVGSRSVFAGDLTKQPAYQRVEYKTHGPLLGTAKVLNQTFWIGVHPGLSSNHINYMLEQLEHGVFEQTG